MSSEKVYVDKELKELIPMFLDNREEEINKLNKFLSEGDLAGIKRLGHDIKGAGGGYGFDKVTEFGRKLEAAAEEEDKAKVEKLIKDLETHLEEVEIVYE